jgi:hypothetical protein
MRHAICALTAAAVALVATAAAAQPQGVSRIAVSAQSYGVRATYRGPNLDVGYSVQARRMTACLASYPGAYDPRSDLVRVAPGVTRRCSL